MEFCIALLGPDPAMMYAGALSSTTELKEAIHRLKVKHMPNFLQDQGFSL